VLVGFSCASVNSAEEGSVYTARGDVVVGGIINTDLLFPGACHESLSLSCMDGQYISVAFYVNRGVPLVSAYEKLSRTGVLCLLMIN